RIFLNSTLYGRVESYLSKKWKRGCVGKVNDSAVISRRIDLAALLSAAVFDPATKRRGLRERQGRRPRPPCWDSAPGPQSATATSGRGRDHRKHATAVRPRPPAIPLEAD